jgi:hypothetical protein
MKLRFSIRDLLWLTLVVAIVLGFLVFMYVRKPSVQEWEYHDFHVNSDGIWAFSGQHIDTLGKQGWEVCGVVNGKDQAVVLLKRPKQ